jgi:transcription initiation factor TFIIE subunit alpha
MKGLAILLIDYLASSKVDGYADEVTIASDLRLSQKNVRKALRYLEIERLVAAETVKFAFKRHNAEEIDDPEVEERKRRETHVFWCLDYPRLVDSFRLRLHRVRSVLKKQIEGADAVQQYICPRCGAKFSSLDAISLLDPMTGIFRCEECKGELAEHLEGPSQGGGGSAGAAAGGAASRRERQSYFKDLSNRVETQLKSLLEQLEKVRDVPPPDYGPLQDWYEVRREEAAKRAKRLEAARRKVAEAGGAAAAELTDEQLLEWAERAEVVVALPGQEIQDGAAAAAAAAEPGKELPAWFRMVDDAGGASVNAGTGGDKWEEVAGGVSGAGEGSEEERRRLEQQYLEQYLAQVRQAQATMASGAAAAAASGAIRVDEKDSKRIKVEAGGIKAEVKEEAIKPEPAPGDEATKKEELGEEEIAWEDAGDEGVDWEDA